MRNPKIFLSSFIIPTYYNDIIIVITGPTGLMLANLLTRFGAAYIIFDQKAGPTDYLSYISGTGYQIPDLIFTVP